MKKSKFRLPGDMFHVQDSLFTMPGVSDGVESLFPVVHRDIAGFEAVLNHPSVAEGLGFDLEFDSSTEKPSILGIANRTEAASIPWNADLARKCVARVEQLKTKFVGHAVVAADRPVLDKALGIVTPLDLWDCTMLRHYLCNPDFCKTVGKEEDESDGGGAGAMGFMNLATMASLYTSLPSWKSCRGKACVGPCSLHDVWGYNGIDSWAGLEAMFGTAAEMAQKQIPEQLHRDLMVLSEVCDKMERQGINVDRAYVNDLEANFDKHKESIFPPESSPFNPRSPKQVQEYFSKHGIALKETDKKAIKKTLEKEAKRRGLDFGSLATASNLPEELDALYRLYEFKDAGRGLGAWFADKYTGRDGLLHPRFIVTGTSMGRLASSSPNFTNIPMRGFGVKVKYAIIPRDPSLDLVKADYSQLEFRKMLHAAGFDLRDLKGDPFAGLVSRSNGQMKPAADFMHDSERQVAKSLVHAYDYLEGVTVLYSKDLERRKNEIENGSLLVYPDWEYRGGVVAFTGGNLAERLFGNKTHQSRKAALGLQELVTAEFLMIRQLHRKILREIEDRKGVQLETGRFLPLYGSPEDDAKMGAAMHGQGGGSDHVQSVMLRYYQEFNVVPLLMVHDSLTFEIPRTWTTKQARDFIYPMSEETKRLPGFICPVKAEIGPNWGATKELQI